MTARSVIFQLTNPGLPPDKGRRGDVGTALSTITNPGRFGLRQAFIREMLVKGGSSMAIVMSRRAALLGSAALGLCAAAGGASSHATVRADQIWFGGPIITMNDKAMRAQAIAVANGKIIAVGRRSDVMKLR